jgi:MYXO-CTERM domain-containing protein
LAIQRPAADTDGEDAFAEVQMFYHVNRVYEFFRTFGFTNLETRPLTAVVNQRLPIDLRDPFGSLGAAACTNGVPQAGHQLFAFDNAAFTPDASLFGLSGGAIVFGQGTNIDFAYDGDVVYHEFTHAVMGTLTPDFGANTLDEFGEDPTTGGMNEGTADYFSAALTGDPDLGEYSGPPLLQDPSATALRHLNNDKKCPSSLWNETHQDGEEWGGALFDVRAALPVDKQHTYDQAVYNAIAALQPDDDQISTAAAIAAEVNTLLGATERDLAVAKFAARGLDDCNDRVIDMTASGLAAKDLQFISGNDAGVNPAPGPTQFVIDAPANTKKIKINITRWQANGGFGGGGSGPMISLLGKPGDAAIRWTYSGQTATHDATLTGTVTCVDGAACTGEIAADVPAGKVVLQLANAGGGAILQNIAFSTETGPATPTPDAGPTNPIDEEDGGCGCRVGGESSRTPFGGVALAGLAAFLIVLARRRRK